MIVRIATVSLLIALYAGAALAQQGAGAPIPPPDAAAACADKPDRQGDEVQSTTAKMAHGLDARERRETKALNWLEATGNRDFSDVHRDGRNYRATVTNDGTQQVVIVDPDNGRITPAN